MVSFNIQESKRKQEKARESKTLHKLLVLGMNDDLWDRVHGLGSENVEGCK